MITITHTHAGGTLIEGSVRGDGVWEILKGLHANWRSFPSIGCLGIGQSRDRNASTFKIGQAEKALIAAGFEVTVTIDESDRRTFAEAEASRNERAADRAERMSEYAGNAAARSDAAYARVHAIAGGIPFGQPILVGHHSEARHRRDIARMDSGMRRSIDEGKKADHYAGRAESAGNYQASREATGTTLRRIEKLEASQRDIQRALDGTPSQRNSAYASEIQAATGEHRDRLLARQADLTDEIAHWRSVIAAQEAGGVKIWSKDDFAKGDFARLTFGWYEVVRVNAKSVTIPAMISDGPVVTVANSGLSWTDTIPYHKLRGHKSAQEMAEILAEAGRREAAAATAGGQS